ncbi:MAG TPA: nitroreductase [Pseudonocardiaceae bacterium]|jgi:nitroreductase|nr:nitroreductase [Pseudonocardiaceae bacterium]
MTAGIPAVGQLAGSQVRLALLAATAAPSVHNSQPWRFVLTDTAIELHADPDRALPATDPAQQELVLACGAALLNLRLAVRGFGMRPDIRLLPDPLRPTLLATVRPQGFQSLTVGERSLREAITRRRTNRRPFRPDPVPADVLAELHEAAGREHATLETLTVGQLTELRGLLRQAHEIQWRDPAFRAEWRAWTGRPDGQSDGVPARSAGPVPEARDEWLFRDFGSTRERLPGKDFEPEPRIVVIGSFHDLPLARVQAGQAMQRVLLTATASGLAASFLPQVVEVAQTRAALREILGGVWPQTVLRLGYGSPVAATPRRSLARVLESVLAEKDSSRSRTPAGW